VRKENKKWELGLKRSASLAEWKQKKEEEESLLSFAITKALQRSKKRGELNLAKTIKIRKSHNESHRPKSHLHQENGEERSQRPQHNGLLTALECKGRSCGTIGAVMMGLDGGEI